MAHVFKIPEKTVELTLEYCECGCKSYTVLANGARTKWSVYWDLGSKWIVRTGSCGWMGNHKLTASREEALEYIAGEMQRTL